MLRLNYKCRSGTCPMFASSTWMGVALLGFLVGAHLLRLCNQLT